MILPEGKVLVTKKNGGKEQFDEKKIKVAVSKSAYRAGVDMTEDQLDMVVMLVRKEIEMRSTSDINVAKLHTIVEGALDTVSPKVAKSYRDYRNFKSSFGNMMEGVYNDVEKIMYRGDKENANKDSSLVSTKKALSSSSLYKEIYKNTFLSDRERRYIAEGDYYIHDMSDRPLAVNCCLFRIDRVLKGGFEMANVWYNEPKTLDVAFDVISDVVLSAASQQYGGFTIPQVDKVLSYYAEKSYKLYYNEYIELGIDPEVADKKAEEKVAKDYRQGFQGWEYKFNTVSSSRGDYPFITVSAGLDTSRWGHLGNKIMYKVHQEGQGKEGHKKPVLFPKYVFLYDEELHGPGKELYDVYEAGLECSSKTMYPDWLSLTGEGYVPSMYKKYKAVVSPMGCRAFLSPYYEKGGQKGPADEKDRPVFEGRFNSGAISLNLPLIYLKSVAENRSFYDMLDERLESIRSIHKRTKDYIGNLYASTNPLAFTQGGFYGGNLDPDQKLKESRELMESTTYSFGITALDELQRAYNGRTLAEDGAFALAVMEHINEKAQQFKEEDHMLYAIYGTPAENLCFDGDTVVQTYGGNKKIKDLFIGDLVYSFNEEKKKIELKRVVRSLKTKENAKVVKVTFDNGQEIICTPDHPFGCIENDAINYIKAENLKNGCLVKGNTINHKVVSVEEMSETRDVYDITVEDNHNFFVGGDDGILVHNCGLQIKQLRQYVGENVPALLSAGYEVVRKGDEFIIPGICDREYVSNSFHCNVREDITPIQKQDLEDRFWDYCNGGKIQYVRYPLGYNHKAMDTLIRRAMDKGFYEGCNMALSYCDDCGYEQLEMDTCPHCGSRNLTKIDRMNGYLAYSRVKGDSRLNDAKMAEINERVSM